MSNTDTNHTTDEWEIPQEWPTVFARLEWADGVIAARGYRGATAAVFHRLTTRAGTSGGCTESVGNIAKGLGIDRRSVQRAIKTIKADGHIDVQERLSGTYICVPKLDRGGGMVSPQGRHGVTPGGWHGVTPRESSSKEKIKEKDTGKEATPVAITAGESGATTGAFSSFSFSEEERGPGPEEPETLTTATVKNTTELTNSARAGLPSLEEVDAWMAEHYIPKSLEFKKWAVKYYWHLWGSDYIAHGWDMEQGKVAEYYQDVLGEGQFERDLKKKVLKMRLPDGVTDRTAIRCTVCETMTKQPIATMSIRGELITDGCGNCPPK